MALHEWFLYSTLAEGLSLESELVSEIESELEFESVRIYQSQNQCQNQSQSESALLASTVSFTCTKRLPWCIGAQQKKPNLIIWRKIWEF